MKVGDLVRYKYRPGDVGMIIEIRQEVNGRPPKHKVMWLGPRNMIDWMRPTGLEKLS